MKMTGANEIDADYLGVQYMYAAGYDPNGAVSMRTQREIDRILPSKAEYVVTTSEYHEMRERLITPADRRKTEKTSPTLRRPGATGDTDGDDRPTLRRKQ